MTCPSSMTIFLRVTRSSSTDASRSQSRIRSRSRACRSSLAFRFDDLTFVLLMKVGVHAGEPLDSIILRKQEEERMSAFLLWGYGGTLCHPSTQVRPFAEQAALAGRPLYL